MWPFSKKRTIAQSGILAGCTDHHSHILPVVDDGVESMDEALRILAETPGSICVMLYMADEKKTYQAPREYWVDEGYDFGALANLLGADNVVLKCEINSDLWGRCMLSKRTGP